MKKIHLIAVAFFMLLSMESFAQGKIEVTVKNIRSVNGQILVGLFSNEDDFLKKPVQGKEVKVTGTDMVVVFNGLPAGDYALSIVHDENENGEMDTNMIGIPKEGFAFGNNSMGTFGPPSFDKAKVTITTKEEKQVITMKYM